MGTYSVEISADAVQEEQISSVPAHSSNWNRVKRAGTIQVVEFILGKEMFAIDLFDTREVITQTEVTPLPSTLII